MTLLKQKKFFEDLPNKRIDDIQTFSKQFDFNNLVYYFKSKSGTQNFIGFYKNLKNCYTTLEKVERNKNN